MNKQLTIDIAIGISKNAHSMLLVRTSTFVVGDVIVDVLDMGTLIVIVISITHDTLVIRQTVFEIIALKNVAAGKNHLPVIVQRGA